MNNKAVITATVGYMALALTGWMLAMPDAGWFSVPPAVGHGVSMLLPLGIVLVVVGILSFLNERTLDAVIFFGGAGLFWSGHEFLSGGATAGAAEPVRYVGWYWFVWSLYFFYVWLGSFAAGMERMLFLLGLWLTLLAFAIGNWSGAHGFEILGGYLGLITSIIAAITSAAAIILNRVGGGLSKAATT